MSTPVITKSSVNVVGGAALEILSGLTILNLASNEYAILSYTSQDFLVNGIPFTANTSYAPIYIPPGYSVVNGPANTYVIYTIFANT